MTRLEEAPAVANLSQDLSCDLSCPSCRTKVLKLREYNTRRLDSLVNADYVAFLSEVANVTISPKGEPFASEHFLRLLSEYCRKAVRKKALHLQTNGLLLTEELWNRLDLWGHVHSVRISVDAASPRVYETLKRGGRFDRLIPNLMFLGQLRRLDALEDFRLTFLVQSANLEEMPGFVRLARHVGADGAVFQRLCDWGTYGAAGFSERDVVSASHPQHFEFRKMVEDPVLRGPDIDLEAILP
ncbi:MAG: hypothetical protein Tsb0019_27180 [Roseibium sp.]